jgi:hypothetical protein
MELLDFEVSNALICIRRKGQIRPGEFHFSRNAPMTKVDVIEDLQNKRQKKLFHVNGIEGGSYIYPVEREQAPGELRRSGNTVGRRKKDNRRDEKDI